MPGDSNGAWKLSPSDFAFLWEQCKRCFVLKVAHGVRQPSMPMSAIFKRLETLQMSFFEGRRTEEILPDLPPGTIRCGEKVVESVVANGEDGAGWYVSGRLDSLIEFDDGSWAVVDFKTTKADVGKAEIYSRQLHGYAYALENATDQPLSARSAPVRLAPVSRMGLLVFEPDAVSEVKPGRHAYEGGVTWLEVPRRDEDFQRFVTLVHGVLRGSLPGPSPECEWCRYAGKMADGTYARTGPVVPRAATRPASAPTGSEPLCPKCNAPMRQRSGPRGNFWGCSTFPACRGSRNIAS